MLLVGRAVTLNVIRRPLTSEARVGSQVSPCEICDRLSATGTGISPSIWFYLVSIIPLMHRTHLHLHSPLIRRTNGRNLITFQKQCFFGVKYFRFNKPAWVDAACLLLLLLLPQLYNSLWVLACSIIPLHGFLSCAFFFQLFTLIFLKSSLTSSSHLNLGLPFGLVACGFHLQMFLTTLSSGILSTCPTQLSLLLLMCLAIFSWLIRFSSSSFVFCLHSPFIWTLHVSD